ncbi:MAG TPA: twin-arginine translocase TatA/TatE family subunit [Bacteroidia bacterium]|jgi:sec-independent protein translocase protein TatA|nr:twin-arginine translocase TatA/TatE family subunit [Bacteroidia bacterium]
MSGVTPDIPPFFVTFVIMLHSGIILFLNLGTGEIMLIMMFIVMFFGADKLPEMARALGKGMREMKNATAEIQREIEKSSAEIQREVNIEGEMKEITAATDTIKKNIAEGISNIEKHYNDEKKEEFPKPDEPNELTPGNSVKRD